MSNSQGFLAVTTRLKIILYDYDHIFPVICPKDLTYYWFFLFPLGMIKLAPSMINALILAEKIIYPYLSLLVGIFKRLNTEIEDVIDFLEISYPENESILVGCRAEFSSSYECCEYDIIVLRKEQEKNNTKKTRDYDIHKINDKTLEIFILSKEKLTYNSNIDFLNYIDLTSNTLKSSIQNDFERKRKYNKKSFKILTKRKSLKFALDCMEVSKRIRSDAFDEKLSSLYLNIMSFNVLELFIEFFQYEASRPTHLKYQMNNIKENNLKIKESIDIVLENLQLERSNISTITRSEKSLFFLLKYVGHHNHHLHYHKVCEILGSKINYFKNNSMYVDANLLIHSFIKRQSFDDGFIKNYNRLLNQSMDVQIKEKSILLKELETLFDINKNFIKNDY
jgi:hypothetical protein